MFGSLGVPEILFILVLALLVFGPRRLPELGRTIGRAMGEFRRASTDLRRTLNNELALEDESPRRPAAPRASTPAPQQPAVEGETGASGAAADPEAPAVPSPRPAAGTEPRDGSAAEAEAAAAEMPGEASRSVETGDAESATGDGPANRDDDGPPMPAPSTEPR